MSGEGAVQRMGSVFGVIQEESPKFDIVWKTAAIEVRKYSGFVVAETPIAPSSGRSGQSSSFYRLAQYIGVIGAPAQRKTAQKDPTPIAMTAPVYMGTNPEKVDMTVPVISSMDSSTSRTMSFPLPQTKYSRVEDAPKPASPLVTIRKVEARFMAAITFSGQMSAKLAHAKREELQGHLEEAGIRKIQGTWQSGQYNPPYTIPFLRTNEILVQVDESSLPRE